VRMLLVHGFNSWDPLVPGGRFDDVYHSNVYHALIASSAQLVGLQAPAAWAFALFFAKLAACSAFYHLAWTVLAERWIAWTSSAIFTLSMAPLSMLAYPNTLAVYWLLVLAVSFLVEAVRGERGAWPAVGLAATSLVLPGVHGLYYVFACLLLGPVLFAAFVRARFVRPVPASARHLVWATLALGLGLPWFAVGHLHHAAPSKQPPTAATPGAEVAPSPPTQTAGEQAVAAAGDTQQTPAAALPAYARAMATRNHGFVQLPSGRTMFDLRPQLDLRSEQPQLVMILIAGLALSRRRRELVPILALTLLVAVMLYVPVVCTFLVKAAGAPWVVRRLCAVLSALHLALVPALLFSLIVQRFAHSLVRLACFAAALGYAYAHGVDSGTWTRASYLRHGIDGKSLYNSLQSHGRKRALFARSIPFGATVALAPQRSGDLVVDCDCYPLALGLDQSSHGLRDIEQRRTDVALLLGGDVDLSTRVAILRHYHVDRLFIREPAVFRTLRRIYRQMLARTESYKKDRVLVLDLSRAAFAIERQKTNAKRLTQDLTP
jgi:hypothetical protein